MIIMAAFVFCICVAVGIYFYTQTGSPAPSPGADSTSPAPGSGAPAPAPVPLASSKYHFVGEGGCTNDQAAVRTACSTNAGCDTIGQQTNGCWHCLQTISTGEKSGTGYTPLLAL